MNKLYSVKQAAKILGVSTNTLYKYLNDGKILSARGNDRGRFRIPHNSLENFLGTPLNKQELQSIIKKPDPETSPVKTLPLKITRYLIIITLILIIISLITTKDFSFSNSIIRILIITNFIIITYQFGGFIRKKHE